MIMTVDLPDQLFEQLERLAAAEHRSVNATILVAVERYVEDRSHRSRVHDLARDVSRLDAELLGRLAGGPIHPDTA